jgi:hypothetical protein
MIYLTGAKFGQFLSVLCNASSSLINSLSTSLESFAVRLIILDVFVGVSGAINYMIKTIQWDIFSFFLLEVLDKT